MATDDALFGDGLALDAALRVAVLPGPLPAGALADAERLLRDLAAMEERRGDEGDAAHPPDPALRRIEAKLDLALQLFAQALPERAGPAPVDVRIGPRGLRLPAAAVAPPVRAAMAASEVDAVLRWQPGDAVPLCLHLPLRAAPAASTASALAFSMAALPEPLDDALARHLFRLHRRALAAQRRG